jgi:hypothetical protein
MAKEVTKIESKRPVGLAEIMRRFGWNRQKADNTRFYRSRTNPAADFPQPMWASVGGNPAWTIEQIDSYGEYHEITPAMSWADAVMPVPRATKKASPKKAAPAKGAAGRTTSVPARRRSAPPVSS